MRNYDFLFQKRAIGSMTAPNLLALHPLERGNGTPEGKPKESAFEWYRGLAKGGWGILFAECTTCSENPDDRGHFPDGFLMNGNTLPDFKRMVSEVKEISPETVVMIQLCTGSVGDYRDGNDDAMGLPGPRIQSALADMVTGGLLAAEAGFDGIDFKLCHGHLPHLLLAEDNTRTDEWGGDTLKKRARFVIEVVHGIRDGLSDIKRDDFIIGARISEPNLLNLRDTVDLLDGDLNMDFLSVSNWRDSRNAEAIAILTQTVAMMKPNAAVIQAGFTSYLAKDGNAVEKMRDALESRLAPDFVGFGRQAIADPLTPMKLRSGSYDEITWCTRCEACRQTLYCKPYGKDQGWS